MAELQEEMRRIRNRLRDLLRTLAADPVRGDPQRALLYGASPSSFSFS